MRSQQDRISPVGPLAGIYRYRTRIVGDDRRAAYKCWHAMHSRCTNPKNRSFPDYGGRGIYICNRWNDFDLFYADMGNPPVGMQLDRIDNERGYAPQNCRWVTPVVNTNNRRNSIRVVWNGKEISARELAEIAGISEITMRKRINKGWSGDKLISGPTPRTASRNAGFSNGGSKLNEIDLERINDLLRCKVLQRDVAALFEVSREYIGKIYRGEARV